MTTMLDVLPGDDQDFEFGFSAWRHVRVKGYTVTGGAVVAWGEGGAPGTVGAFVVGSDGKSLVLPLAGFVNGTDYHLRATVTFSSGDVVEFDVGFRCKIAPKWVA